MTAFVIKREIGMLVRVIAAYGAWLTMVFANIPLFVSVFIVATAPMFMGSVVWHLWKTRSLSAINVVAFCGALAFFAFLAIQIFWLNM